MWGSRIRAKPPIGPWACKWPQRNPASGNICRTLSGNSRRARKQRRSTELPPAVPHAMPVRLLRATGVMVTTRRHRDRPLGRTVGAYAGVRIAGVAAEHVPEA